jgi:tetratricopeptide (TPR) repeat protein
MKKLILSTIFAYLFLSCYSQDYKPYFINEKGEKCNKSSAKYKRLMWNKESNYYVKDFYLNDTLYMEGNFSDVKAINKEGVFKYYHINGNLERVCHFENNKPAGTWEWYDITGKLERSFDVSIKGNYATIYGEPMYPGGKIALNRYIETMEYPFSAVKEGYHGNAIATFKITDKGYIKDIDIILHCTPEMDTAIVKHLEKMPRWEPAHKNGSPTNSMYKLPINFIIDKGKLNLVADDNQNYEEGEGNEINDDLASDEYQIKSEEIKNISKEKISNAFFVSGVIDYKEKDFESAIHKFNYAIEINYQNAKYYYYLAMTLNQLHENDKACSYFKIANSLDDKIVKEEIKKFCGI